MYKHIFNYLVASSLLLSLPAIADTANVNLYGVANVSYDIINTGIAATGTQGSNIAKASSNASRIGFKGSENLGDGLSAKWQIETLVLLDNSSNSCAAVAAGSAVPNCTANNGIFATRNSYASLGSKDYGSLLIGRYDTPYKITTRKLDNFADSIADNRSLFGSVSSVSASKSYVTKQPDVFSYSSPNMNGFTVSVAQVNLAETATTDAAAKASATSYSTMYEAGNLYSALAYETHKLDTVRAGASESAWVASLRYTLEDFSLAAAYESSSDTLGKAASLTSCSALTAGANCLGHTSTYLTGKYTFGSNALKLAYTKTSSLSSANNTGANQISLGYDHRVSKRNTLYAIYTKLTNETLAKYNLGSSSFSSAATTAIGAGSSLSAISFGLKQVF